jgi:CheY-like chemotaxis protein
MLEVYESGDPDTSILVVDDEPVIADTLCAILAESGFTTSKAYNGEDAIRLAEAMRPHIVLSDVLMPRMSGIQMAIQIQQFLPDTRIVLLSGQAATAEMMRQAAAEGHQFELLAKPIHPEDLIARLKELSK